MTTISLDSDAIEQLGGERKVLLDAIDDLRKHGIGRFVDLPQIIVVGDQSAGKSSVLEAISRVRFPVKAEMCTRFPTELVLRTDQQVKINVQIQPASVSTEPLYKFNETSFDKDDLSRIIDNAKTHLLRDGITFSEDVLRIEICSPDVPHLTLVDLPGFYHSLDVNQPADGQEIVDRLVRAYMARKNSIILAIVSARSQVVMQKVLLEVNKYDKNQERTLGIITKPDLLIPGSRDEDTFIKLARNQEPRLRLAFGWHVLRNRGETETSLQPEERDSKEKEFFESGIWSAIPSNSRGVDTLRKKLSNILLDHIRKNIDPLIKDIQESIDTRKRSLERLGTSRSSPPQLRAHLDRIASQFQLLSLRAIEGNYSHEFFGGLYPDVSTTSMEESRVRKLRALVRELNQTFAYVIATKGSRRIIVPDKTPTEQQGVQRTQRQDIRLPSFLKAFESQYSFTEPEKVTRSEISAELEPLSSANQGTEFPGTTNDLLAVKLFRDQSHPWEAIARCHIDLLLRIVKTFTERLMAFVTGPDQKTYSAILLNIVDPFLESCTSKLESKLQELLCHFRSGYPQPSESEFRATLARRRQKHLDGEVLQGLLTSRPEIFTEDGKRQLADILSSERRGESGAEDLIDKAETYYELSLRNFTDNVTILAVENCLIKDLPSIFTTSMVSQMEDDMLERLAAESSEMQIERAELEAECETLQKGFDLCKAYRGRKSTVLPDMPIRPKVSDTTIHEDKQTPSIPTPSSSDAASIPEVPQSCSKGNAKNPSNAPKSIFEEVLATEKTSAPPFSSFSGPSPFTLLPQPSHNILTDSTGTTIKPPAQPSPFGSPDVGGNPTYATGNASPTSKPGLFGASMGTTTSGSVSPGLGLFGAQTTTATEKTQTTGGLFSNTKPAANHTLFSNPAPTTTTGNTTTTSGLFGRSSNKADGRTFGSFGTSNTQSCM
ncbi:P-loop containing nucleoside triphosphate hydrolase protein [Xylaria bambusicola]|uniref:P-loop containing nucleoside triphosphate hydrolase protein n=1 Tax=Xylaria bambusicola TaxID=326684 RepID=UPI00200876B7|nr:P-loop containing nucleoside triphosphate hydrolase protein [Xylaria bambusicola]KAI0521330.1 P-loop containing nucleoside triphosphate hydrolase protein [Xylaria bambusicola]